MDTTLLIPTLTTLPASRGGAALSGPRSETASPFALELQRSASASPGDGAESPTPRPATAGGAAKTGRAPSPSGSTSREPRKAADPADEEADALLLQAQAASVEERADEHASLTLDGGLPTAVDPSLVHATPTLEPQPLPVGLPIPGVPGDTTSAEDDGQSASYEGNCEATAAAGLPEAQAGSLEPGLPAFPRSAATGQRTTASSEVRIAVASETVRGGIKPTASDPAEPPEPADAGGSAPAMRAVRPGGALADAGTRDAAAAARAAASDHAARAAASDHAAGAAASGHAAPDALAERSSALAFASRTLEEMRPAELPGAGPSGPAPTFAAELSRLMSSPAAADTPPTTEVQVPVPVGTSEFVPRLSSEIAVLARDGVQEARVNLHPAELGPISVQIRVEGEAAQVHLAVDNALTRQILESALPTLAGALRETGLTLTGGGVFEQSRQGAGAGDGHGAPGRSAVGPGDPGAGPAPDAALIARERVAARAGGLDLYA
jgi:flagellar hook-length control protein FliK